MKKTLDKETIKAYLLGRISEEETLAAIEEALFSDDEFAAEVELAEDEIINDYVFENLPAEDRKDVESCFFKSSDRQFKLKLTEELKKKASLTGAAETPTFLEKLKAFFARPVYVGAFTVLLIAAIGLVLFLSKDRQSRELAELREFYKKDRTVETRISEFDYAPLNVTRGENEDRENQNKLRRIENGFLDAVDENPTAENRWALGVFYLTQRSFAKAADELETAEKLDEKNAKIANDLGSAYFERALNSPGDKALFLAKALEKFRRATELDQHLLEAFFNRALCLEQQGNYNEAKDAWNLYLQKDPRSDWADEARKHLESLEEPKKTSKTKEQVLEDFLSAFRAGSFDFAWKINCQTKEMVNEVWLPGQLTRRRLEAERDGREPESTESIDALRFIGEREKEKHADFFVAELAEYYSNVNPSKVARLLEAKDLMSKGLAELLKDHNSVANKLFDEAAGAFSASGNVYEAKIAEFFATQPKPREGKIKESLAALDSLAEYFEAKKYRWLRGQAMFWISQNYFLQAKYTKTIDLWKQTLRLSEEIGDTYGEQKSIGGLMTAFERLGESTQSLKYFGQIQGAKDLYYQSALEKRRSNNFAADLFARKKLFAAAESFGKENVSEAKNTPDKTDLINGALERLAKIYTKEKRFNEALQAANESKNLALNKPESSIDDYLIAKATLPVAEAKLQMDRCDEALADYDSVIEYYSRTPEIKLNNFVAHKGRLFCFQALNRQNELESELRTVLDLAEKYRSQILADGERLSFFDNEQVVYDVAVENSLAKDETGKAFELAESSKARSLLDFVAGKSAIVDIENRFPEVSKPLSLAEIQTRMPENVQIVQFAVLRKKTVVWTIARDEIKLSEIAIAAEDLEAKVSAYLELLAGKTAKTEIERPGRELYDLLVAPVFASLDPSKEICLIPDKTLHRLPFAALITGNGKFFIEDFRLLYSPSASVFVFASEKAKALEETKDERLLSVGNPLFDREKNASLPALPSAEEEARSIAKFYPNAENLLGADATKARFLKEIPQADIIHFAGHYVADGESPRFSRLLFSAGGEESDLRSFEIAQTKLPRAKLVVLSACRTGIEKFYEGEGAIGAARTFLAVGAPLVVASNWNVESESAKDLMVAFHRYRREEGMSASEALRRAQIDMLNGEKENFRPPYFWAAFSIIGAQANY